MDLSSEVEAAIGTLGGSAEEPAVDFLVAPEASCRALDATRAGGGIVVRVAPDLPNAANGFGPAPVAPRWIRIERGARTLAVVALRAPAGARASSRTVEHVALDEHEEPCCDAPSCDATRTRASVWLVLQASGDAVGSERLLVAEQRTLGDEPERARTVGGKLAAALGVPLVARGEPVDARASEHDDGEPADDRDRSAVTIADLARLALRSEGDRVVLRAWGDRGPRASARRNAWIGAVCMVFAVAAWIALAASLRGPSSTGTAVATGIAAALLSLTGYAFLGVARFSAKYHADSAPLAAIGRDRIVVAPWVGRDGSVDARAEGRFGAAIPLVEVRASIARPRDGGVAVELDTDHGPIDVVVCATDASAKLWCAAIDRAVDEARHPRQRETARQRARQRARASA